MKWNLKMSGSNKPLQEAELKEFEKNLGAVLPDSYRSFLLYCNGGTPFNNAFDVYSPQENLVLYTFTIQRFLGIGVKDDLVKATQMFKQELPPFFIPIASDNFRNFMCLSVKTGEVYFWDCQYKLTPKTIKKEKPLFLFVYETFEDFIDNLYRRKN